MPAPSPRKGCHLQYSCTVNLGYSNIPSKDILDITVKSRKTADFWCSLQYNDIPLVINSRFTYIVIEISGYKLKID